MSSIISVVAILTFGTYYYEISFLFTILAISFMIFFHELGHFLAARFFGVCVKTFSIGFGKKVFSKKIGQTTYAISAIPLGGYVSMKGQDDLNPNEKSQDKDSYTTLNPYKKIIILSAGPFFNIFLAFFIYIWLGFIGVDRLMPIIGQTMQESPANQAGLLKGDRIISIDNKKIIQWEDISKNTSLTTMNLEILRDGKIFNLALTPKISQKQNIFGETISAPLIGIMPIGEFSKIYHKGSSSISFAFDETIKSSKLIFTGLGKLITGVVPAKEMGGIIAMTDITSKAAAADFSVFLIIVALISVNLGIINLFPIPVLDGGHILFNIYEIITKKAVSEKVMANLSYLGMSLLATLFIFTIINDILRLIKVY